MKIVLDGMGSDTYPDPEIEAAIKSTSKYGIEIILTGKADLLESKLKAAGYVGKDITVVDAPDVVEMDEHAVEAIRKKPNNSMGVGMQLVKNGQADAFVTAGNTGAAYFSAVTLLRRLPVITRPCLCALVPTLKGNIAFTDTGANVDCRPEFFLEFAVMASVYAEKVLGRPNPKVALLANGEEETKGNAVVQAAHPLLKSSGLNFIGNVEPKEIYRGEADVVVADGFAGNVFIKTSESVAKMITDILKEDLSASTRTKIGYLLAKPAFKRLKTMMDPAEIGAAMLLGVNGNVFIGHGRSGPRDLISAIGLAVRSVQADMLSYLKIAISEKIH